MARAFITRRNDNLMVVRCAFTLIVQGPKIGLDTLEKILVPGESTAAAERKINAMPAVEIIGSC